MWPAVPTTRGGGTSAPQRLGDGLYDELDLDLGDRAWVEQHGVIPNPGHDRRLTCTQQVVQRVWTAVAWHHGQHGALELQQRQCAAARAARGTGDLQLGPFPDVLRDALEQALCPGGKL